MVSLVEKKNVLRASALVASFLHVAFGNPMLVQERATCNRDDCLRQISNHASLALPYCLSVVGTSTVTTTVVTTVAYGLSALPFKRDIEARTTAAASSTPTFVSSCKENPTAVYSGCSCFLGTAIPTTTTTTTSTTMLPLPSQCSASNNYGLTPNFYEIYFAPGATSPGTSGLAFTAPFGSCCAYCFASPNCFGFYTYVDPDAGPENGEGPCSVEILGGQPVEPLGVASCPAGTATLTSSAVGDGQYTSFSFGPGPCGTVMPTSV